MLEGSVGGLKTTWDPETLDLISETLDLGFATLNLEFAILNPISETLNLHI